MIRVTLRPSTVGVVAAIAMLGGCASAGEEPSSLGPEGTGDFCENVAWLEVPDFHGGREAIQAVLEAQTPSGAEEDVATIGRWIEIVNAGDDPYQDPDFTMAYDAAWKHLARGCGLIE